MLGEVLVKRMNERLAKFVATAFWTPRISDLEWAPHHALGLLFIHAYHMRIFAQVALTWKTHTTVPFTAAAPLFFIAITTDPAAGVTLVIVRPVAPVFARL